MLEIADLPDELDTLREVAAVCTNCHLYQDATQTVFGEGSSAARVMLVGEQPGDKEDLAGAPFVGPAGKILDRGLEEAGIDRKSVYVTNAVKHFKWKPAGKVRLHQKPNAGEVRACRPWLEAELRAVRPELVIMLGATAAQSSLGNTFRVTKDHGKIVGFGDYKALATVHPSSILRARGEVERELAYQGFVQDLTIASDYLAG
jgi:uracil-DNA glycosylase